MTWFPDWSWLWHPSGAAVAPEDVTWWRRLTDAPILAHPLGMLIAVALFTVLVRLADVRGSAWIVWAACMGWGVLSQWWKNHHERYGAPWGPTAWTEMTRRLAIEQATLVPAVLVLVRLGWL